MPTEMYYRHSYQRKAPLVDAYPRKPPLVVMDPSCAICRAPAQAACECEAKSLAKAIKDAEDEMMRKVYEDIRGWVKKHARDYILDYFHLLAERRKDIYSAQLDRLYAHAMHHFQAPPNQTQVMEIQAVYKRGIDEDWSASVQRYPEVLQYYFGLVELHLPAEDEPGVKDPPLSGLNSPRKARRRPTSGTYGHPPPASHHGSLAAIAPRMPQVADRPDHRIAAGMPREKRGMYRPPTAPPVHMGGFYPPPPY